MKYIRVLMTLILSILAVVSVDAGEVISLDNKSVILKPKQLKLLKSVQNGEYAEANELLKNYNINDRTESGITLLWWTANSGDYESFLFFLENGASPLNQTLDTYNIMELCASRADVRFLKAALKYGSNSNLISYYRRVTPIFLAVQHHNVENVSILLNSGAALNIADTTGRTPALWASEVNAFEILLLLLKSGADPSLEDIWGLDVLESLNEKELKSTNAQLSYLKKAISFIEEQKKGDVSLCL